MTGPWHVAVVSSGTARACDAAAGNASSLTGFAIQENPEGIMAKHYDEGDKVKWEWGNGEGTGKVTKKYTRKTTLKIDGSEITRNADDDDPAYKIEQDDGSEVLKSHSELKKAS